jgi:hypothetical protein
MRCAALIAPYARWIRTLMGEPKESLLIPGGC